jgi:ribosomal-protein-alanine N-acetyltransferase
VANDLAPNLPARAAAGATLCAVTELLQPELTTARLQLRAFGEGDAEALVRVAGPLEVTRYTRLPHPLDGEGARAWIERQNRGWAAGQWISWAAIDAGGELRGGANLRFEPSFHSAEVGFWLGRASWGQGFGTELARAATKWAFLQWGARRVEAHCVASNVGSARVLERAGFRAEGRLREAFERDGEVADLLLFGLLRREWEAQREPVGG